MTARLTKRILLVLLLLLVCTILADYGDVIEECGYRHEHPDCEALE